MSLSSSRLGMLTRLNCPPEHASPRKSRSMADQVLRNERWRKNPKGRQHAADTPTISVHSFRHAPVRFVRALDTLTREPECGMLQAWSVVCIPRHWRLARASDCISILYDRQKNTSKKTYRCCLSLLLDFSDSNRPREKPRSKSVAENVTCVSHTLDDQPQRNRNAICIFFIS